MKIRLFNVTTGKWVKNADSDTYKPVEYLFLSDAVKGLERVNDLKRLNPNHRNDVIEIRPFTTFEMEPQ